MYDKRNHDLSKNEFSLLRFFFYFFFFFEKRAFPWPLAKKLALFDRFLKENNQKQPKFDMTR